MPSDLAPGFSLSTTPKHTTPLATSLASWRTSGDTSTWTSSPTCVSTVFLPSRSTDSSSPCAQAWPSWRNPTLSVIPACHSGWLWPAWKGSAGQLLTHNCPPGFSFHQQAAFAAAALQRKESRAPTPESATTPEPCPAEVVRRLLQIPAPRIS